MEEPDDIIFTNSCGDEIGRIILPGDDITHQIKTDYVTNDPLKVDPIKIARQLGIDSEDIDAVGIDLGYTGVLGGGMHFGEGIIHFLDGDSEGETYLFGYRGGGVGLDAGVGMSGFISNFDDNSKERFFNAENWEGNYAGYSIGGGKENINYSWGNEDNIKGQLWTGQQYTLRKSSPPTWHTWTVGGAFSGEARGGASVYWGESFLQNKF
ncbi:hypothetical protein [Flavobacterium sp. CS20]|uniref:hypothetical protein n=1 Tax=Flavobacterium sp. CS20 TaxID=2775246 RepID=UPI001B39DC4F|nr:hypothetical protein [Flavobacterium sp. CS20]QTY26802.1 hypothetical protein IGB25_13135 [Flavobacterium sp. CS20]